RAIVNARVDMLGAQSEFPGAPPVIQPQHLELILSEIAPNDTLAELYVDSNGEIQPAVEQIERYFIERTLSVTHGNKVQAANHLGINRNTLAKKMRDYGLEDPLE
ncbi:MAG: hypothetical protein KDD60_13300, partial [Bdellovibrionales bacterium]|nr:hypothetical protein [Bdellovibrionales bacterium]